MGRIVDAAGNFTGPAFVISEGTESRIMVRAAYNEAKNQFAVIFGKQDATMNIYAALLDAAGQVLVAPIKSAARQATSTIQALPTIR